VKDRAECCVCECGFAGSDRDWSPARVALTRIRSALAEPFLGFSLRRKETHSILVTDGNFAHVSIDDQGHPQVIRRDEPPISA